MPADRKKHSRESFKQSQFEPQFDLQWNSPTEFQQQTIEFTTNVTPTTYTDDNPPPLHTPTTYIFPPEENIAGSDAPKPRNRKGSGYIPRPPNAFILFRSSFIKSQHVTSAVETNHSTLSKIIGMTWQNLPHDERQAWHVKAKEAQEEHKRKWPQYAFKPASSKATRKKRKVRETEPKDIKRCEKIVELLCNGKKGDELNDAVKDFDRCHVPQIITRFEAPITARAYRRSSSAPLPDTDYEQAKQSFLPSSSSVLPQRRRSSSAEPDFPSSSEIKLPTSSLVQFDPAYSVGTPAEAFSYKQEPGFIDFSAYSFGAEGFAPLFGIEPSPSPPIDFNFGFTAPTANNPRKLSINTGYLNQWVNHDSPITSIPGSPSYYSASSPSEVHTPYSDEYYQQSNVDSAESFGYSGGYNPYTMDIPEGTTCASSPESMSSYYPDEYIQQPQAQYPAEMTLPVDYAAYGSYSL